MRGSSASTSTRPSSLASVVARELGLDLYEIMHGEEDGRNTSLGSRLVGVQVCNEQIAGRSGMMMVDEADQILSTGVGGGFFGMLFSGGRNVSEKGQVNSMLDSIRVPTVWISNADPDTMGSLWYAYIHQSYMGKRTSHHRRTGRI